jgi:hypothetical protein
VSRHEHELDALVEDAIEILIDRALRTVAPPRNPGGWRATMRMNLHAEHDARSFELLASDPGLTSKALADLLDPVPPPPRELSPSAIYDQAEQRRRELAADTPDGWLDRSVRLRCLAAARAALHREETP